MDTRPEIKRNIEDTRSHISFMVDQISDSIHHKVDWKGKVKENPTRALIAAVATGFILASFSSPIGRSLLRFGAKSAMAALGAYISKRGIEIMSNKIKSA